MKILMMSQHYAPEEISGSVLGKELATDLVIKGYQVTYVTCVPNYPTGIVYPGYKNHLISEEMMDGVRIIRTWSYISPHKSFWRRILNYGTFSATALIGGLKAKKPDIILSFSPPLPLGITAWMLSRLWRVPWILSVGDIFPEIAIVTGVLRNPIAISFFLALEKFLYRKADHIQVISEGFQKNLRRKGVLGEKISVIPVWADPEAIRPMPKENGFRQRYGLSGKFVVMHAGNFGVNNSLEDIIGAAEILKSDGNIWFVMIGEGEKKTDICEQVSRKGLKNVLILPYQPRDMYESMLAAADLGLVTLSQDAHHTSFPSKTLNIMSSGRPILAVTPLDSEISTLVQKFECGVVVPTSKPEQLVKEIIFLRNNPDLCLEMGKNGRSHLEMRFSRNYCLDLYDKDFQRILDFEL